MQRNAYPYTTTTQALSVFDQNSQYRPLKWLDASSQIDWLNQQDNGLLLTLLEMLPSTEQSFDNPVINWTEDSRLDIGTQLTVLATATDTVLKLDDPYIVGVGNLLVFPNDGEAVMVTAINYDLALTDVSWQNAATVVGNIKVTRGYGGTAKVAKTIKSYAVALPKFLAEQEDPKIGVGQIPGLKQFQYLGIVAQTFKTTRMQDNSLVYDNWGQLPRAQIETILDVRRKLAKALLFAPRMTIDKGADGQLYIPGGLTHFIKTNVLDLGTLASNHTWDIYNDFFYSLFRADASSQMKSMVAGEKMFATMLKLAKALNGVMDAPYYEPKLMTDVFTFITDEGHKIEVMKDRYGLAANEGLSDWAFVLDMAHISGGKYAGYDFQWFQNIQDNRSIQVREDAYVGSAALIAKHESCHGIIRGGSDRTINQR